MTINGNMPRRLNLEGVRFGRLVVVGTEVIRGKHIYWKCLCDCGNTSSQCTTNLRQKKVQSCGCYRKESSSERRRNSKKNVIQSNESMFNNVFCAYRSRSASRGFSFSLTREEFRMLTKRNCTYCGKPPSSTMKKPNQNGIYIYNGIDRVDTSQGYYLDNCTTCCGVCNRMKMDLSLEDFINHIHFIMEHYKDSSQISDLCVSQLELKDKDRTNAL